MSGWTWKRPSASGLSFDGVVPIADDRAWRAIARNQLDAVLARHCPVRHVQASPIDEIGRLVFGDGTVLLARARRPGNLGRLAVSVYSHSISQEYVEPVEEGNDIVLSMPHGPRIALVVVGLDQPD